MPRSVTELPTTLYALFVTSRSHRTFGAKTSWVYLCPDTAANTWNMLAKVAVEGAVSWTSQLSATISGSKRVVTGNGLPSHATGTFPISSSDPAYPYDRKPQRDRLAKPVVLDSRGHPQQQGQYQTHAIVWNGKTVNMYHYHMTYDYPYSLGCYRGAPAKTSAAP